MDGKPPVVEPPVLALLEEVCLAVVPLQRPVHVAGEAPLGDALGVLVTPHMGLSEDIFLSDKKCLSSVFQFCTLSDQTSRIGIL